jgi:hypothetical protein
MVFHSKSIIMPPKLAPAVVPKIEGLANGFRNSPWTNTPPTANAAPASILLAKRHHRSFKKVSLKTGSFKSPSPTVRDMTIAPKKVTTKTIHVQAARLIHSPSTKSQKNDH